jgi:7-carboxy-7-deazaguanine synthase
MKISEHFYSIQGEGVSFGVPSYFIRMTGCNLVCGGRNAELLKEGKASWYCDSEKVWRNGNDYTNEQLLEAFKKDGALEGILNGRTHLIWTGGEPTLPRTREGIEGFLNFMNTQYAKNEIYNEVETNGTIEAKEFYGRMQQVNCSPKLANSGMSYERRLNVDALQQINQHPNSWFKFVVSTPMDMYEINDNYIQGAGLSKRKIILMPGVDNLKELPERTRFVFDMAKKTGYRATTRGQVLAWDKTTGV